MDMTEIEQQYQEVIQETAGSNNMTPEYIRQNIVELIDEAWDNPGLTLTLLQIIMFGDRHKPTPAEFIDALKRLCVPFFELEMTLNPEFLSQTS